MNWQDFSQKGGLFRGDRRWTDTAPITSDQSQFLAQVFRGVGATTGILGHALGLDPSTALSGYNRSFNLQLSENGEVDPAHVQQIFGDLMSSVLQEQVSMLFDQAGETPLADYIRDLKQTGDALTQTINEFVGAYAGLKKLCTSKASTWKR
jgi:hypothetical protein